MWGGSGDGTDTEGDDDDDDPSDSASTDLRQVDTSRFHRFEVANRKDQEENVAVRAGFMVR